MSNSSALQEQREILTAQILQDLHAHWQPHDAQKEVLSSIFYGGKKNIYVECGRKFGKSEVAIYFLCRYALLHPRSASYYIAPLLKQAKEIIWSTQRLQAFIPAKYIKAINNTELRLTLTNDAFIKLDGSDNSEAYRGVTPHALVADEIAQHDRNFWVAMSPNRAVHDGPLLVIGTPPERENYATELKEQFQKNSQRGAYFNFPSAANPHISHEWLEEEKKALFERGEEDVWYREYEAKFVRSGKNAIFPMFDKKAHVRPYQRLVSGMKKDMHKMQFYVIADPGSTSVFAVLVGAFNPFTREMFLLDEIYETNQSLTSTSLIHKRIDLITAQYPGATNWTYVYDEAAAWFRTEASNLEVSKSWTPTNKVAMKRDTRTLEPWGLSIIKDALLRNKWYIADSCTKLIWEMENYHRTYNRAGDVKVLKRDDHLIDCERYMAFEAGLSLTERAEPTPEPIWKLPRRRAQRLEDELNDDNWYS